jgi:hypothetical protein
MEATFIIPTTNMTTFSTNHPDNEWVNISGFVSSDYVINGSLSSSIQYQFSPPEEKWQCIQELIRLFTQVIPDRLISTIY